MNKRRRFKAKRRRAAARIRWRWGFYREAGYAFVVEGAAWGQVISGADMAVAEDYFSNKYGVPVASHPVISVELVPAGSVPPAFQVDEVTIRHVVCGPCARFFARFSCANGDLPRILECDCPRCQGYCGCEPAR